jgi:hypothetical protein
MSEVKVNKISPRSGTGVTLGDSGDTFTVPSGGAITIASGATITNSGTAVNFGATGSASWVTTVKTGDFTAVAGEGYFVNTTSGEIDVTLPASPSAGDVVAVKDYADTWDTNNCILLRNGSNIGGQALDSTLSTEGLAVTLVYVDATKGWLVTDSGLQSEVPGPRYITATGGTITTQCTNFKVHTFTGPGTFTVCSAGNTAGSNTLEYIVVAGGGSGGAGDGTHGGGGGGAGGFRFASPSLAPVTYPGKPLAAPAGITASASAFPITVGGGATGGTGCTVNRGSNSVFSTITSTGGGSGGNDNLTSPGSLALPGGSGGGSGVDSGGPSPRPAGVGNTPPVSPAQGMPGGHGNPSGGCSYGGAGAGGGAIVAGSNAPPSPTSQGGAGGAGAGIPTAFASNGQPCGSFRYYAGGGGGGSHQGQVSASAPGGVGGGGASNNSGGVAGTTNTGGGGGSTPNSSAGATGGSGIVIIRYKFQ